MLSGKDFTMNVYSSVDELIGKTPLVMIENYKRNVTPSPI